MVVKYTVSTFWCHRLDFCKSTSSLTQHCFFTISSHINTVRKSCLALLWKYIWPCRPLKRCPLPNPTKRPQMTFRELLLYLTLPWYFWMSRVSWNLWGSLSLLFLLYLGRLNGSFLDLPILKVTGKGWKPAATFTFVALVHYLMLSFLTPSCLDAFLIRSCCWWLRIHSEFLLRPTFISPKKTFFKNASKILGALWCRVYF